MDITYPLVLELAHAMWHMADLGEEEVQIWDRFQTRVPLPIPATGQSTML